MKLLKYIFVFFLMLIFAAAGCIFYSFQIEPYRVKVNEYAMNEEQMGKEPVTIVQISDLHMKDDFTHENLDKVVTIINEQNPDIVVFTGDLYDNYAKYHDDENIITKLKKIQAKYEKIAIWGNRDYGGGAVRQYETIMERAGFTLLKNEKVTVTLDNKKKILFMGLDDSMLGNPYIPDFIENSDSDYRILLTHEPDSVLNYLNYDYNMVLSGHSHGGQVNIPFLPMINKKAVSITGLASKYSSGMYPLNNNTGSKLYVNTGIGTTHISARFGVVPEIAVFQIYL